MAAVVQRKASSTEKVHLNGVFDRGGRVNKPDKFVRGEDIVRVCSELTHREKTRLPNLLKFFEGVFAVRVKVRIVVNWHENGI